MMRSGEARKYDAIWIGAPELFLRAESLHYLFLNVGPV
jgi:hypothetical protein